MQDRSEHLLGNLDPALRRCWHPVARSSDVGEAPARSVLLGEPWVLYRSEGALRAFKDRCPHRFAPLSLGTCEEGGIRCAYHGWRYGPDGRCVEIPALGPEAVIPKKAALVAPAALEERHGMVFLAPEEPVAPLGRIAEADDASFMTGELPTLTVRASIGLLADNFLDVAHFPFVHKGTFGADEAFEVTPFSVERDGWAFEVSYTHEFAHREDPAVAAGVRPLIQRRRVSCRLDAPFHLYLRIDFLDAGGTNVIGFFLQPETEETCRVYTTLWRDDLDGDETRMKSAIDFELAVLEEDLAVQTAYDVLSLPLSPTTELHTRADRATLELRRVLTDLVGATS